MSDLQERMTSAREQRLAIIRELEQEKQQEAESPAARLAAVDAELAALDREKAIAAFEDAKRRAAAFEHDNRQARRALTEALAALDLPTAKHQAAIVVQTAQQQRALIAEAVTAFASYAPAEKAYAQHSEVLSAKMLMGSLTAQFTPCWELVVVLMDYVHNGPEAGRHERAGLAYALLPADYFTTRPVNGDQDAGRSLRRWLAREAGLPY